MARMNLRCTCGMFFIAEVVPNARTARCPACGHAVGLQAPTPGQRVEQRASATIPEATRSKAPLFIALGGVAAALLIVVIILIATSGGDAPSETAYAPTTPPAYTPPPPTRETEPVKVITTTQRTPETPKIPNIPAPPPANPSGVVLPPLEQPLPTDLVQQMRDVLALPAFYSNACVAAHLRARVDGLLASGKGKPPDVEFLRSITAGEKVAGVRAEMAAVTEAMEKLEAKAADLPMDQVLLNDGRTLQGNIVESTPEAIKLNWKRGETTAVMVFQREAIKEILKHKGIGAEFKTKWAVARKAPPAERPALIAWCKENNLADQAKLVAWSILSVDPGHALARSEVGLPLVLASAAVSPPLPPGTAASPAGTSPSPSPGTEGGGGPQIAYSGKNWSAVALKDKLIRDGYVIINGQWHGRKDKTISVPGLFKYEKETKRQVMISGDVPSNYDQDHSTRTSFTVGGKSVLQQREAGIVRRFYAPMLPVTTHKDIRSQNTPEYDKDYYTDKPSYARGALLTGTLGISTSLDAPIIEASVMTKAEVKAGGSIVIFLMAQNGKQERLYQCGSKEDEIRRIPDALVRGTMRVDLVAQFSMPAAYSTKTDKRVLQPLKKEKSGVITQRGMEVTHDLMIPDYTAVLFPSNSNTIEVFRLKAVVAEPADGLNKLFADAGATDILK